MATNGPIGSEHIILVNVFQEPGGLRLKLFIVGGPKKIQIRAEDLIRTVPIEQDFGLGSPPNFPADQPVPHRRTDSRDVVGLNVPNDLGNGIKELLGRHDNLRVLGADVVRDLTRITEVRRALKADRIRLQRRPAGFFKFSLHKRGDQGGVQAARQQRGHRPFREQALSDGGLEAVFKCSGSDLGVREDRILDPGYRVIRGDEGLAALLGIDLHVRARLDRVDCVVAADFFKSFHFAGEPEDLVHLDVEEGPYTIGIPAHCGDSCFFVHENEGKDAVQGPEEGRGIKAMEGPERS